jgi:hypothetical protein
LTLLFFSSAALLHLMSDRSGKNRQWLIATIVLSIVLVFSHSISTALYLLSISFLFLAFDDRGKRRTLGGVGLLTFITFIAVHLDTYSDTLRLVFRAMTGDASAWQSILLFNFPSVTSLLEVGPLVALANTGIIIVIGILVLLKVYRLLSQEPSVLDPKTKSSTKSLVLVYRRLRSDPEIIHFFGFGLLALLFGVFFSGSFLDPLRMLSWASLFALPTVLPRRRAGSILFMTVLLFLFFLLIWTVYSPWGSPFGSSPNLETNFHS